VLSLLGQNNLTKLDYIVEISKIITKCCREFRSSAYAFVHEHRHLSTNTHEVKCTTDMNIQFTVFD